MQTREEISSLLNNRFGEVVAFFGQRPDDKFCKGPVNRWTEGQHLDHLILSTKPLNMALRLPKFVLSWKFGVAKRPSETLESLMPRYEAALAKGGKAPKSFVPPAVKLEDKQRLLETLRKEGERLVAVTNKWSEGNLDKYVLPHPLLGKLTIRTMLLFSYYHMQHHLDILKRDY